MAEKERKRQGIVNSTKLPFLHFEGKDLSKFRRIPAEFCHLEEKARKRKGKETDRRFLNHSKRMLVDEDFGLFIRAFIFLRSLHLPCFTHVFRYAPPYGTSWYIR